MTGEPRKTRWSMKALKIFHYSKGRRDIKASAKGKDADLDVDEPPPPHNRADWTMTHPSLAAWLSGKPEDYKELFHRHAELNSLYLHEKKKVERMAKENRELEIRHLATVQDMDQRFWDAQHQRITKMMEYQIIDEARHLENSVFWAEMKAKKRKMLEAREKDIREERFHFATIMNDDEILKWFGDIHSIVNQLVLTMGTWDPSKEKTWPFPPSAFGNRIEPVAKRNIQANTLWFILYDRIFCSPFRVFGTEAPVLEQKWITEFGQDPQNVNKLYPPPTEESEIWRYEAIRTGVKAISQISPSHYREEIIKNAYDKNLDQIRQEVIHEWVKVAIYDNNILEKVERLIYQAATFWLEVNQLRERISIWMTTPNEIPRRSNKESLDHDGILHLTVVAGLRRTGGLHGEDLDDKDRLISTVESKFSSFKPA